MTDVSPAPGTSSTMSAGQQLRAAREACGLHIVALAAALKVPARKLEALEANRWEELTDATFVRALASSVARHLKIDATPILQALPAGKTVPIEVPDNLGHAGADHMHFGVPSGMPKVAWLVLALLLGALALYALPDSVFRQLPSWYKPVTSTDAIPAAKPPLTGTVEPVLATVGVPGDGTVQGNGVIAQPDATAQPATAPNDPAVPASPTKPATAPLSAPTAVAAGALQTPVTAEAAAPGVVLTIRASADTWIEVIGQDGALRAQRLLKQGDTAEFADAPGYAVVLGNAAGARVWVRGTPWDIAPFVKNNIARFDVK